MSKRVLLAGLFHETHTFLEGRTTLDDFDERTGVELLKAEGDGSPLAAAVEVGRASGWEMVPTIDLRATPSPMVDDAVVERFWDGLKAAVTGESVCGFDGVYLVLHGAMVSDSYTDVEGEVLERVRKLVGPNVPICGVLDLHGNHSARMAECSNGFVAYRENPHADAHNAARDGALLLDRLMRTGERAVTVWERPPIMWPPTGTGTAFEPMRTLEAMARQIERDVPEILAVNVFGGFSFADTEDTGVSFTAVTVGDPGAAQAELRKLAAWAMEHRAEGNVQAEPLASVLEKIRQHEAGPIVVAEPADNIGGGAPGDTTPLLKALIDGGIQNAAVAINDPEAVQKLRRIRPGERMRLSLGGRGSRLGGGPIDLEVELLSTSDGKFTLEDRQSHLASMSGTNIDMGPCATVRHGGVRILLTTYKTPPFDLGLWRSQGIVPEELFVICVKAAVAHRRVYDPILTAHYTVETPGPCSSNLKPFPFRHVRRPVYPLDEV